MKYYVISQRSSGGAYLYSADIKKNQNGYYNAVNRQRIEYAGELYKCRAGSLTISNKNNYGNALLQTKKEFYLKASITKSTLDKLYKNDNSNDFYDVDQIYRLMSDYIPIVKINYLDLTSSLLQVKSITQSSWTITRTSYFCVGKSLSEAIAKYNKTGKADYTYKSVINSSNKSSQSYFINYDGSGTYSNKGAYLSNLSSSDDLGLSNAEVNERDILNNSSFYSNGKYNYNIMYILNIKVNNSYNQKGIRYDEAVYIVDNKYDISCSSLFGNVPISVVGIFEIGSLEVGANNADNYCFYSNNWINAAAGYLHSYSYSLPYVSTSDLSLIHDCNTHGAHIDTHEISYVANEGTNSKVIYKRQQNAGTSGEDTPVQRLKYGTTGVYKDGVASLPYVMIELRGEDTAEGNYKSLSIPANNFVSLNHERNMGDSYNTFQLQLFDKDALQVESWLLMGFRYITFWYTDFVSTSKRFKGQVLDYKTTIVGTGLMLTLSGYTSNVDIYTGKDSIPWSKIVEARSYSFLYWLNDAGEYHGEVRMTTGDVKVMDMPEGGEKGDDLTKNVNVYNSTDGVLMSLKRFNNITNRNITIEDINKNDSSMSYIGTKYCLKAPFSYIENGEQKIENYWTTFQYYYRKASSSDLSKYTPKIYEWDLNNYGYDLERTLSEVDVSKLTEPRPSNIVILIAVINGWKLNLDYIMRTRIVSSIPDQVSQSFIGYIKEHLIPISMSDDDEGITQYNIWFDDDGYVHYGPTEFKESKKLYFNSKEIPDSYPLISYTSSSNGAILMKTNATQSIDSINIYTGDEYNANEINNIADNGELLKTAHVSEEWYTTSMLTLKNNNPNADYISYQNTSVIPSQEDLIKELKYRYGLISKYSYKASIDVYGCADLTPGQLVDIYIYLGNNPRSDEPLSSVYYKEGLSYDSSSDNTGLVEAGYIGNTTVHHSSGTYIINKITDSISGGKYMSTLEVLKLDSSVFSNMGDISKVISYKDWIDSGFDDSTGYSPEETFDASKYPNGGSSVNPNATNDIKASINPNSGSNPVSNSQLILNSSPYSKDN